MKSGTSRPSSARRASALISEPRAHWHWRIDKSCLRCGSETWTRAVAADQCLYLLNVSMLDVVVPPSRSVFASSLAADIRTAMPREAGGLLVNATASSPLAELSPRSNPTHND